MTVRSRFAASPTGDLQPARVALTGTTVSPPLFDGMETFGRHVTPARLRG